MLTAVCLYALIAQFMDLVACLTVDGWGNLKEGLSVHVGSDEFVEGDKLGVNFMEGAIALQYFLNER